MTNDQLEIAIWPLGFDHWSFMKAQFGTKSNFRRSALLGMQIPKLRAQMRWKRIPYNRLPADFRFEPANLHSQARASGNYLPKAQSGKFWFHVIGI